MMSENLGEPHYEESLQAAWERFLRSVVGEIAEEMVEDIEFVGNRRTGSNYIQDIQLKTTGFGKNGDEPPL